MTGLDPAGPLYDTEIDSSLQISPDDANFVDVYHTNRAKFGQINTNSGSVNIFVNAGDNQPGCTLEDITPIPCKYIICDYHIIYVELDSKMILLTQVSVLLQFFAAMYMRTSSLHTLLHTGMKPVHAIN